MSDHFLTRNPDNEPVCTCGFRPDIVDDYRPWVGGRTFRAKTAVLEHVYSLNEYEARMTSARRLSELAGTLAPTSVWRTPARGNRASWTTFERIYAVIEHGVFNHMEDALAEPITRPTAPTPLRSPDAPFERTGSGVTKTQNDQPAQLERCGSCNGVINQQTGECRCS